MAAEPRPDLVPVELPDYFRDDLPVSRGGWGHIARLFCFLAGEPVPTNRLEATRLIVRLRDQAERQAGSTETPPPMEVSAHGDVDAAAG